MPDAQPEPTVADVVRLDRSQRRTLRAFTPEALAEHDAQVLQDAAKALLRANGMRAAGFVLEIDASIIAAGEQP